MGKLFPSSVCRYTFKLELCNTAHPHTLQAQILSLVCMPLCILQVNGHKMLTYFISKRFHFNIFVCIL